MALNTLTLSTTQGQQGRPFSATVSGLSAGSRLEIGVDGAPGFSTVNGKVYSGGLPYPVSTLVLIETLPGTGIKQTRIDITAVQAFSGGGAALTANTSSYLASVSQNALIASLGDPYAGLGLGATTYATFGTVPGQLALSGSTIVGGATASTAGSSYSIGVRATSGDGKRDVGETLVFSATSGTPALNPLTLSSTSLSTGGATSVGIVGATSGSTITATSSDGTALTVSGSTLTGTFTTAGSPTITLVETLSGATGSPRTSTVSVTVSAGSTSFYQLASNRFAVPTDVVASAAGYASGTANQQGNGTAGSTGTHTFRRFVFDTFADAGPSTPGVFDWIAAAQLNGGVYDMPVGSAGFTIEGAYLRKLDETLITQVTWSGSTSITMTSGMRPFNDPITATMPAGTYIIDVCCAVPLNGALPIVSPLCAIGEYGVVRGTSGDVTYATGTAPTSGKPAAGASGGLGSLSQGAASYGPSGFYIKTSTVIANALLPDDSREDRTNILPDMLDGHGDFGPSKISLSKTTTGGGRMAWLDAARYGSGLTNLQPSSPAVGGLPAGRGLFKYLSDGFIATFGQTRSPYNEILCGHGINSLAAGASYAGMQTLYRNSVGYARALWPNIPWAQKTLSPFTGTGIASPYLANTDDTQTTPGVSYAATAANGGFLDQINAWIASGGGGLFNLAIDIAAAVRSPNNYQSWKNEPKSGTLQGYPGTLGSGVPANTVSTITLDFAPDPGSALAIDVGASTVETINPLVGTVTVNATNSAYYDVTLRNPGQQGGAAKKVAQAHANGVAVKESSSPEGLHPSHKRNIEIAAVIDASKAQIRSLALAYTGS